MRVSGSQKNQLPLGFVATEVGPDSSEMVGESPRKKRPDNRAVVVCCTKEFVFFVSYECLVHPGRLTWNLQITHLERKMIFQTSIIVFHVNLPGCNLTNFFSKCGTFCVSKSVTDSTHGLWELGGWTLATARSDSWKMFLLMYWCSYWYLPPI